MNRKTIIRYGFLHAFGAAAYIALVAAFITSANKFLGQANNLLGIMAFLLTLVISVAVMGLVIFGRPAMWYLNGSKKRSCHPLSLHHRFSCFNRLNYIFDSRV